MKSLFIAVCLILALHCGEADITCETVGDDLYPCIPYVAQGGSVPDTCCTGIRTLNSQAQTRVDRQSVCRCIQPSIDGGPLTPENIKNFLSLPAKCGVNLPYTPSPNTNCDSIN